MAATRRNVVEMDRVAKEYLLGEHTVVALHDVSLTVEEGAFLAIAGPSGSGKSTLLNLIGCIDTPSRGQLRVAGHLVNGRSADELAVLRARNIGFVFQTFNLFPVLTAEENVEYPLLQMDELSRAERRERVVHFLNVVQLAKFARHRQPSACLFAGRARDDRRAGLDAGRSRLSPGAARCPVTRRATRLFPPARRGCESPGARARRRPLRA